MAATIVTSKSFADAVAAEVPGLLRYARSITADSADAEDLVSDTVVRALERQSSYRGDSSLATWLHRILHNRAVDRFRRRQEHPDDSIVERVERQWRDDAYTVDAASVVERAETRDELNDALVRLPFIYRSAVLLHDGHGLTAAAVADVQQVSVPAAKQRLRRGRMMLVTALAEGPGRRAALQGVPMGCWQARSRVSDYLDGELADDDRRLVERHLEVCPTCPPLYASLVGARSAMADRERDPDSVIPPHIKRRLVR